MTCKKADLGSLYNMALLSFKVNDRAKQETDINSLFYV